MQPFRHAIHYQNMQNEQIIYGLADKFLLIPLLLFCTSTIILYQTPQSREYFADVAGIGDSS